MIYSYIDTLWDEPFDYWGWRGLLSYAYGPNDEAVYKRLTSVLLGLFGGLKINQIGFDAKDPLYYLSHFFTVKEAVLAIDALARVDPVLKATVLRLCNLSQRPVVFPFELQIPLKTQASPRPFLLMGAQPFNRQEAVNSTLNIEKRNLPVLDSEIRMLETVTDLTISPLLTLTPDIFYVIKEHLYFEDIFSLRATCNMLRWLIDSCAARAILFHKPPYPKKKIEIFSEKKANLRYPRIAPFILRYLVDHFLNLYDYDSLIVRWEMRHPLYECYFYDMLGDLDLKFNKELLGTFFNSEYTSQKQFDSMDEIFAQVNAKTINETMRATTLGYFIKQTIEGLAPNSYKYPSCVNFISKPCDPFQDFVLKTLSEPLGFYKASNVVTNEAPMGSVYLFLYERARYHAEQHITDSEQSVLLTMRDLYLEVPKHYLFSAKWIETFVNDNRLDEAFVRLGMLDIKIAIGIAASIQTWNLLPSQLSNDTLTTLLSHYTKELESKRSSIGVSYHHCILFTDLVTAYLNVRGWAMDANLIRAWGELHPMVKGRLIEHPMFRQHLLTNKDQKFFFEAQNENTAVCATGFTFG